MIVKADIPYNFIIALSTINDGICVGNGIWSNINREKIIYEYLKYLLKKP